MFIHDLIIKDKEQVSLDDLFLADGSRAQFLQLIREHRYIEELTRYSLPVSNKLILHGSSGCGKTATAKAIAAEMGKELLVLNLSNVVSARMGETAQNIKMVFEKAARDKAVLFLDEFDQVAKIRSIDDRDAGEMRRLVTTIIQLIDYYPKEALLICATNHLSFIDPALLRRFEVTVGYSLPENDLLDSYYDKLLSKFPLELRQVPHMYGISFAQARDYVFKAVKSVLLDQLEESAGSQRILA